MTLLLLFLLLALATSFACSLWEAVLLSITPSFVSEQLASGRRGAGLLDALKRDIERPLVAILSLNTIAHTIGAIGVGAQANKLLGSGGVRIFGYSLHYEALVAAGMTLAILIVSEIVPKTLGANHWKRLAVPTALCLRPLVTVLFPLVWFGRMLTHWLSRDGAESVFSHREFLAMSELGLQEGRLGEEEYRVIQNLLRFREQRVREIMTPRTVVIAADADETVTQFLERRPRLQFSRVPVYRGSVDSVIGMVMRKDLLAAKAEGQGEVAVASLQREVMIVPDLMVIPRLLRELVDRREQLAVVVDEYGASVGVVTFEDVIEELLGLEVMDESDRVGDMQELARRSARRAGSRAARGESHES
ncbi:hemolysin family protein [Algiphilus sp. W345]|uniref:Hemolysin family protein n=1 Tax=Banduia mediterranea TaxID=3075609 RepID=A0ABU2WN37_9GAMM|nr:hemolysin family protein [Algiphilus sp. W345]MDT0498751.1 hemolysin family protein [Algiphilus sp. W345]